MGPTALGFPVESKKFELVFVSEKLTKAVSSKQLCLCVTSAYQSHKCGQHLEEFFMEGAGSGVTLCCLILSTLSGVIIGSESLNSKHLQPLGKTAWGVFLQEKGKASRTVLKNRDHYNVPAPSHVHRWQSFIFLHF